MNNNKSLLNKTLYHYRYKCRLNSSPIRFLTPCETLNEYINDPCSIFNGTIIPTGPVPPVPPIPPIPPVPPEPILGFGEFISVEMMIDDRQIYRFNTIEIQGNDIQHIDGSSVITLAPNRIYSINWSSETIINRGPFLVGGELILDNVPVAGGGSVTNITAVPGQALNVVNDVIINTGPNPSEVLLVFISNIGPLESTALMRIDVIG